MKSDKEVIDPFTTIIYLTQRLAEAVVGLRGQSEVLSCAPLHYHEIWQVTATKSALTLAFFGLPNRMREKV